MRLVSRPTWLTPSASVLWAPRHASCSPSGTFSLLLFLQPSGGVHRHASTSPWPPALPPFPEPSLFCPPQCCHIPHPSSLPLATCPCSFPSGPPSRPSLDPELCRPQPAIGCQVLGDLRSCAAPGLGVQLLPCLSSAGDRTSPPEQCFEPWLVAPMPMKVWEWPLL